MDLPAPQQLLDTISRLTAELHPDGSRFRQVTLDSALDRDLGLDSLARMELLARLEREYGVRLPEQALISAETPRDLLLYLGRTAGIDRQLQAEPRDLAGGDDDRRGAIDGARTLVEVLHGHLRRRPDADHIVLLEGEKSTRISYGDLHHGALKVAACLQRLGLQAGQPVAIMLPTGRDYFFTFFGILYGGGVPVPLYPPARPSQIEEHVRRHRRILANAGARLLLTMPEVRPVARLLMSQVVELQRIVTIDELYGDGTLAGVQAPVGGDIAFIQYTSGSTGDPKGVVLSHANLLANIRAMGQVCRVTGDDVFVSWLPLYHDMGLIGAWFGSLCYGCRLVVMPPLSFIARPLRWLEAITRFGGTLSASPNFGYQLCTSRLSDEELAGLDLSSWRMAFNGAEPVIPETMRRFAARFASCGLRPETLAPVYGLAESSVGLAFPQPGTGVRIDRVARERYSITGRAEPAAADDPAPLEFVCCGRPLPGHQIRIVDARGRELPERREGRLQFKGPSSTSGYYRNPDQTRRLFYGEWLDSGDLAYIAGGAVYITSRLKDLIIRGGRNIYPHELEEAVGQVAGIRKGCTAVFGSREKSEEGERLVVLTESRQRRPDRLQQLREKIVEVSVEVLGVPADEVIIAAPGTVLKTSSGKIRRAACRELYERGQIGRSKPAVWLQLAKMALAGVVPTAARLAHGFGVWSYAGYCWLCLGLGGTMAWLGLQVLPGGRDCWRLAHRLAQLLIRVTGITLRVEGLANLPDSGGYLLVSNHMSYLDAIILTGVLPDRVQFVGKAELGHNILLRRPLAKLGVHLVERFDAAQGVADTARIGESLGRGERPFFFAEGTLQRMPGLLPFQMGAFVLASEQMVPVVPVAISGTRNILRSGSWLPRRGQVRVAILASQLPEGGGWPGAIGLRNRVRQAILDQLGEPDLAGEFTSLLQMEIDRPEKQSD